MRSCRETLVCVYCVLCVCMILFVDDAYIFLDVVFRNVSLWIEAYLSPAPWPLQIEVEICKQTTIILQNS